MKSWFVLRLVCGLVLAWEAAFWAAGAPLKPVRLRNEVIVPGSTRSQALAATAKESISGLFLVQFEAPPTPVVRTRLAAAGCDLLHYVPDDTFLVRVRNRALASIQGVPGVTWVGRYRPEHKIHQSLLSQTGSKAAQSVSPVTVSLLLAPRVSPIEGLLARRLMTSVRQSSSLRSGTVLRGTVTPAQLRTLARSEAVLWIEPAHPMKLNDEVASKIVAGDGGQNLLLTQELGYDGTEVRVAVADSGLNNGDADSMHPDLLGRTPAFFYYGSLLDAADEHSHGTHVAGIIAGSGATGETDDNGALYGLGVAPGASVIAQRIFDGDGNYEAPANGFKQMARDALSAGADIGSNSWGDDTQGRYDLSAMEFDELVRDADDQAAGEQPYILEFSAGNAGPGAQTIGSPAVAKNVLATGAAENDRLDLMLYDDGPEAMADFSSRGPCEDGRIKPDVVAPGTWIASLQSASATDQYAWAPISANYQYQGGTSQAGPHASGAAAVFVQYYRETHAKATPSPALVKAALINSAADLYDDYGTGPVPNMDEGWGRIDLVTLLDPALTFDYLDQTVALTNGQTFERRVVIASAEEALKVTLVYTDVPGFPGALAALVNDLDLEVIAPDGRTYHGNQFDAGESVPDAATYDTINNVEAVHLATPMPGEYLVRIHARSVVQAARPDSGKVDQDFALVVSGQIPAAGVGTINLDRGAYTAPSGIKITVVDTDLAGQASTSVVVSSSTETNGETVVLMAASGSGSFTGTVATAKGPAARDEVLQLAHEDGIEAVYYDASKTASRFASARADFLPPVLSNPTVTFQFGQPHISWQTDEPANSKIYFGTNATFNKVLSASTLVQSHSFSLADLIPGRTYHYQVVSADEAGNATTNNNGGALYSFVAPRANAVLLVDAFVSSMGDNDIPLSVYTDPLEQLGVSYDVWNPTQVGHTPGTNDYRPYRAVIWRFNDGVFTSDTFSPADQNAIRSYLRSGGAFFLASMDQLTRIGAGAFRHDVLHVADFAEDTGVPGVEGVAGDFVSADMSLTLDYSQYDNFLHQIFGVPDDISDTMALLPDAAPIYYEPTLGLAAGLRYPLTGQDSTGRVVFLSFPLDAVPATGTAPNNRLTLMSRVLNFLMPGLNGQGMVAMSAPAYTLPSTATIEVGDDDLAGLGSTSVMVRSTTDTNGLVVGLRETALKGLFRGQVDIVSHTNPPALGRLRARAGDQVWVEYFDASANTAVGTSATIDTAPPVVADVFAEPDYEQAVVYWSTLEPASSAVQFGESPLLGRTAEDSALVYDHAVLLPGLLPDRTYYYQVVSRDAAGNVVVDDHQRELYTFQTLRPLQPPWSDNLESGATNWSVYTGEESQMGWTLGKPANGQEATAHSPTNAWGSNLNGGAIDYVESFLISPAIFLSGGNTVTLRFWHSYDFSFDSENDIINYGELLLLTNNATAYISLGGIEDDVSPGWVLEEVDLTPYAGQVVYLVWDFKLLSFGSRNVPGWLIDDVSITVSNVPLGTIIISNNLWQAVTTLSGPLSRTNHGATTLITNAPAGQYSLLYSDVPYYLRPTSQTRTLASGETILFEGKYTMPDVNQNGISDLWEQDYLGSVATNAPPTADADRDGMSDYAEFVAGTDPKNPGSNLRLTAQAPTSGKLTLSWPTVSARAYCVYGSSDGLAWTPVSSWLESSNSVLSYSITGTGRAYFLRVAVRP